MSGARSRRLDSLKSVRLEMAEVYHRMKSGKVAAHDGGRMVYALAQLSGVLAEEHAETRLAELERQLDALNPSRDSGKGNHKES